MSVVLSKNICTDKGDTVDSVDIPIQNDCIAPPLNFNSINYCNGIGGVGSNFIGPTLGYFFNESEWITNIIGTLNDNCTINNGTGNIGGANIHCNRTGNFGDPLICALRDYQCNGVNQLSAPSCFSDNNLDSTCNKDFRAPDTEPSQYLLNQFCLGNIPQSIYKFSIQESITGFTGCTGATGCFASGIYPFCGGATGCSPTPGAGTFSTALPFYSLWTDSTNPNDNGNKWQVLNTPPGTIYRSSEDIALQANAVSQWILGATGAPQLYYPQPDPYKFGGQIPPCQQIFWRTLYGNQPVFQNNYYKSSDSQNAICPDGSDICDNTSIPPQAAACGAVPFGGTPTTVGIGNAQTLLDNAIIKYNKSGGDLLNDNIGSPDFNNFVYSVCQEYPYLCSNFLENTVCKNKSYQEVINDANLLKWCGCYLSTNTYESYVNDFGLSKECTPFCNRPDVIPSYDPDTNLPQYCNQSVCIIDDVTITLAKTTLEGEGLAGGNINFNQICNACSATNDNGINSNSITNSNSVNASTTAEGVVSGNATVNCQCILKNFTLTTIGATIEGGINISQACNGNAKCYSSGSSSGGQLLEIDCHGSSTSQNSTIAKAERALLDKAEKTGNYWIILFAIILIGLIIIAWLIIAPRGIPERDLVYTKKIELPKPTQVIQPPLMLNQKFNYMNNIPGLRMKYY